MAGERRYIPASEFCASVRDGTHDSPKPVQNGRKLVTSRHLTTGRLDLTDAYLISEEDFEAINKRSKVDRWDVLISMIGTVGEPCLIKEEPDFAIKNIGLFKTKSEADGKWLFYFLRSKDAQQSIREQSRGTTQQYIPLGALRDFPILVADDPEEQKAIAAVLGALDDKIELNRRMNATLEAMARALFQSWFVDFDPVRAKLDGRPAFPLPLGEGQGEGVADLAALFPDSFQDSALGPIPKGWSAKRLTEAIEVNPRRTLKAGTVAPYLDMKNLPTQGHSAEEVIDREFSSGTKFQNGDTLLARITPCLENGKTGYVDFLKGGQVGWGSTEYIVLAPKPPLPPQFGYLLARSESLRSHAIQNMTGTSGRQRVPSECFNTFWLAGPPPDIAKHFDELTAPLMAKLKANADQSRTLATLRDTLLPKLLSGELSPQMKKMLSHE
jgi:type I restriction enzyme S subunit